MRLRISYGSAGIILILARLSTHVLSQESASSEDYRLDDFNGRKYNEDSAEEPLVRLFDESSISKSIDIDSDLMFSSMESNDELLPESGRKLQRNRKEDRVKRMLYVIAIFRENLIRVFGHLLYTSDDDITDSQYSSLYLIREALRHNLVYMFHMLPVIHKLQGQSKVQQLKMILTELVTSLPPYLKSTAEFLLNEIRDKRFSAELILLMSQENPPDFLDNLKLELKTLCRNITPQDEKKGYDEASRKTERILGPVFVMILYDVKNLLMILTQRLFAVILISLPRNTGDPILEENIRYIFELAKFEQLPFWDIVRRNPDTSDPYKLIHSTISKILARDQIPIVLRESLFYIKHHLRPITITYINPMHHPIKKILRRGFNVDLILSSIALIDFSPDTVHLRDRLLHFIHNKYFDMEIVLDGMNTFIHDSPMDLLIALLTRMQKRLRPSSIEIQRTISALLSALVLKKEMCTFRPNISQNIDILTMLGSFENPASNVTLWKQADSLHTYILTHPDQFTKPNTLIPSDKKKCILPRQCIANIDVEKIENRNTYKKLQTLQQLMASSNCTWKDVCWNDSLVTNGIDNSNPIVIKDADPEDDQSKNPLIGYIYENLVVDVPAAVATTTRLPLIPSRNFVNGKDSTTKRTPFNTTSSIIGITIATTTITKRPVPKTTDAPSMITEYVNNKYTTREDPPPELEKWKVSRPRTEIDETLTESTKTTAKKQVKLNYPVVTDETLPMSPSRTEKSSEKEIACCLLPKGIKPNTDIHINLNNHGIPSVVSGKVGPPPSGQETVDVPSIATLLARPNTKTPFFDFGTYFETTILTPLRQICGPQYLIKIFGWDFQFQLYPTNIALLLALLEKALLLPEISVNVKLCRDIEKYIKVINYLSVVLLMPMLSQYKHIKGNVLYSIVNENDPKQNAILDKRPTSLSHGTVCFPLLHPKYYLQAVDHQDPYAGLLPEVPSDLEYIQSVIILKHLLAKKTIIKLIGSHFNPLAYPNRGTLLCGILQALSKVPYVKRDAKLSYVVKGYLRAILFPAMYTTIPSSFIMSFPVEGSEEVPSINWEPDLPSLLVTLPPARTPEEVAAMKVLRFLLSKENLLSIIGIIKPPTNTKRSVFLIQIIERLLTSKNVQISQFVIPVLNSYVKILKTNPRFDASILWVWVRVYIVETEIRFDQVILNSLVYKELPYDAKLAYNSLMKYFSQHPEILQNLPGFAFNKHHTHGLYLRALFMYLLQQNKINPSVMLSIKILLPHIKVTGRGATPLPAPKIRPM